MSSFVLCDDADWEELYQPEYHKWFRVESAADLLGHPRIIVRVHENWQGGYEDERIEYLEQQLETLATFGYIKLVYVYEDHKEEVFKVERVKVIESPQVEMFTTESTATIAYEMDDGGCEGGACKI